MRDVPTKTDLARLRSVFVAWFRQHGRKYPWRETEDPFKILIAEMMLRRTKADQVKTVYERLFAEYPDVRSLAEADRVRLEEILYSLGLRWRTPAFRVVAREIVEKHDCRVPDTRQSIAELPGVGEYVSGAVLSIAYGKRESIVDSNVVRFLKRYFGVKTSKEGRRDRQIVAMAKMYISEGDPRENNLALLDFTALVCRSRNPRCQECPLSTSCHHWLHSSEDRRASCQNLEHPNRQGRHRNGLRSDGAEAE